jgi:hypothetical protein
LKPSVQVYGYYIGKGIYCIVLARLLNLAKTDVEVVSGGDVCEFSFAYECAVEEDGYFAGK